MRSPGAALLACALLACKPSGTERLAGSYRSTWGLCVVQVAGREAVVRYPRGLMICHVEPTLAVRCDWKSGEERGKATFQHHPDDDSLRGTWGRADSDSDGGAWVMVR